MSFISYAQNFEDVLLWRALRHVERGRYLDIGAQDPIVDSVSKLFHLNGWSGVHVEPTPTYAAALRSDRPNDKVIQAIIAESGNSIKFYEFPDTGLSTGVEDVAQRHIEQGYSVREINVPTMSLNQLLDDIGRGDIHWMKIDVEGMERAVLQSWHDHPARPWIVLVESTYPNTQEPTHDRWIGLLTDRGYHEVYFDGLSRYFVADDHREFDTAFAAPPNVFDGFNVAAHHFSAKAIMAEQDSNLEAVRTEQRAAEAQQHEAEGAQKLLQAQLADERDGSQRECEQLNEALVASREEAARQIGALEASLSEQIKVAKQLRSAEQSALKGRDVAQSKTHQLAGQLRQLKAEHRATVRKFQREALEADHGWRARFQEQESKIGDQQIRIASLEDDILQRNAAAVELESRLASLVQKYDADFHAQQLRESELLRANDELLSRFINAKHRAAVCDELVRKALAGPVSRWHRLGRAIGLTEEDSARQTLRVLEAQNSHLDTRLVEPAMNIAPVSATQNPYLRANSLPELLSWHDIDFIRCAYVTVLGRQPDPAGELYYIDRIRNGHSKFEVLWQLRKSPESRSHDPGIAGFDRNLRLAKWSRQPFLGWFIRLVSPALEGDSAFDRHSRSLINSIWRDRIDMRHQLASRTQDAMSPNNIPINDLNSGIKAQDDAIRRNVERPRRIETVELKDMTFQSPLQDYFTERFL